MDDITDGEETTLAGLTTAGAAIYALAFLAVGTALVPAVALPLFAAAYAVGMMYDLRETLPSGMPAWLESLLALAVAAVISGTGHAIHALLVMVAIQSLDDVIDYAADAATPGRNLARRVGRVEVALLAAICLVLASRLGWALPAVSVSAYAVLRLLEPRRKGMADQWSS